MTRLFFQLTPFCSFNLTILGKDRVFFTNIVNHCACAEHFITFLVLHLILSCIMLGMQLMLMDGLDNPKGKKTKVQSSVMTSSTCQDSTMSL